MLCLRRARSTHVSAGSLNASLPAYLAGSQVFGDKSHFRRPVRTRPNFPNLGFDGVSGLHGCSKPDAKELQ